MDDGSAAAAAAAAAPPSRPTITVTITTADAAPVTPSKSAAASAGSDTPTPSSAGGKRRTPRHMEPHISLMDEAELAIARRWAAAEIKLKTGLDLNEAVAVPVTPLALQSPREPAAEKSGSAFSTMLRKMLSSSTSSPATSPTTATLPKGATGHASPVASPLVPTSPRPNAASAAAGAYPLFGVPVAEMVERAPAVTGVHRLCIPAQVHEMLKFLRKPGRVDVDGIFRVSGSAKHIDELQAKFMLKPDLNLETVKLETGVVTVHDVAALLKLFLRNLPEPLLTVHFERLCPLVQQLENGHDRLLLLQLFYISLPPANRDCFESLVRFLHRVARERNKMNATNLALVFAPAMLTHVAQQDLQLHQHVVAVLKLVISRYEEIFKTSAWLAVRSTVLRSEASAFESSEDTGSVPATPLTAASDAGGSTTTGGGGADAGASAVATTAGGGKPDDATAAVTNGAHTLPGGGDKAKRRNVVSQFFSGKRGLRRANTLTEPRKSSSGHSAPEIAKGEPDAADLGIRIRPQSAVLPSSTSAAAAATATAGQPPALAAGPAGGTTAPTTEDAPLEAAPPARSTSVVQRRRRRPLTVVGPTSVQSQPLIAVGEGPEDSPAQPAKTQRDRRSGKRSAKARAASRSTSDPNIVTRALEAASPTTERNGDDGGGRHSLVSTPAASPRPTSPIAAAPSRKRSRKQKRSPLVEQQQQEATATAEAQQA